MLTSLQPQQLNTGCSIITTLFIAQISNMSTFIFCLCVSMAALFFFFHNIYTSTLVCIVGSLMHDSFLFFHNIYTRAFVCIMGSSMPDSFLLFHHIYTSTFFFYMGILMPASFFFFHILKATTYSVCSLCTNRSITCKIRLFPFFSFPFYCSLYFLYFPFRSDLPFPKRNI